jgi:hypothetical protein
MPRLCTYDDFPKEHLARGYCKTHYSRWKRTGSPELGPAKSTPWPAPTNLPPVDYAWAAGFFEGEGTVGIHAMADRRNGLGYLVVSVVNTDREHVDWFQSRWPGKVRAATGLRPDQRPAWVWVRHGVQAAAFLRDVEPYLRSARVRAKFHLGLEYQRQKVLGGNQGLAYRERQGRYHLEMKALNRRGVAA